MARRMTWAALEAWWPLSHPISKTAPTCACSRRLPTQFASRRAAPFTSAGLKPSGDSWDSRSRLTSHCSACCASSPALATATTDLDKEQATTEAATKMEAATMEAATKMEAAMWQLGPTVTIHKYTCNRSADAEEE